MSRTARRIAARRKMYLSVAATVIGVVLLLGIFALQLLLRPDPSTKDPNEGNTDTVENTVSSATNSVTDSATDSDVTDLVTSESETDTSHDTNSVTDGSVNASEPTDSNQNNGDETVDFSSLQMILVNPDNPIPDDFPLKLSWVSLNGYDRQVHSVCAQAFKDMVNAAKEDGIILNLHSTYRGIALQTDGYNKKVQEYINKGYSEEEAKKVAATIVAVPGTSEHHTGLAADITTPSFTRLNRDFDKTDAFRWLKAHCAEYGFILRYPEDKTEITKIIYEPWHYRYVGKEAAKIIMSEGICYEEYLEKYGNQ